MFKSYGNNISIPNNYVYTSNKGTEYMYLDGSWMNCSTLNLVESTHNFKMNKSALQQINEHNTNNTIQIGKSYKVNQTAYTYVGRGNFTINGNLLSESINSRVKNLFEAEDNKFSDTNLGDTNSTDVPNGYVYTSGKGKKYFKKNGSWFSSETKQPINQSASAPLERAAKEAITKHNSSETVKIGTEWKSKKGVSYKYVGDGRFISDSGKLLPSDISRKVLDDMSSNTTQGDETQDPNDEAPEVNVGGSDSDTKQNNLPPDQGTQQPPVQNDAPRGSGESGLQGLADRIKSFPKARNIIVLLSRGDEVSLLAADILLSGKQREAVEILNSLNNTD